MPEAYYSKEDRCWYVPVANEMFRDQLVIENARLELRDGQLWITPMSRPDRDPEPRYQHLRGRERQEAIRESNQRAGGDPYGG